MRNSHEETKDVTAATDISDRKSKNVKAKRETKMELK